MVDKVATAAGAVAVGVQRGDALLVRVFHDGSLHPGDCVLRYAFTDGALATVKPSPGSLKPLDPAEALLRQHDRLKAVPSEHFDFTFSPRPGKLVRAGVVKVKVGEKVETIPWAKGFSFSHRIPRSSTEFRENLTFRRRRHVDEPTVYKAACDVLRAYMGTPEATVLAPYLVNSFVIATYKAVATDAKALDVLDYASEIQALIDGMSPSPSMRLDREIARLSVHTAMWHYAVHIGDTELFDASMKGVEEVSSMDRVQHPTFAFNASKSLILAGLLASFSDRVRARSLFDLSYVRFRAAAAIRTSNPTWLRELSVSLSSSILALEAVQTMKTGAPLTRGNVRAIAELAPRVNTPAFGRKVRKLISDRRAAAAAAVLTPLDDQPGDDVEMDADAEADQG